MYGQWRVTVEFMQAPWTGKVDLAAALETLLLETGEVATAAEVLTFGRGSGEADSGAWSYMGKEIPDLAGLAQGPRQEGRATGQGVREGGNRGHFPLMWAGVAKEG